jgi:hypothetical protein
VPDNKSKRSKGTAPDVSCLSFITELPDADKLSILKATGNNVLNIQTAYEMAISQGGIDHLAGWIIHMSGKLQSGEVTPPVSVKRQTVNRFNNFESRNIDYKELERLELEQLKGAMREKEEPEEGFIDCFADM